MRMSLILLTALVISFAAAFYAAVKSGTENEKLYKVELSRVENELREHAGEEGFKVDTGKYPNILRVVPQTEENREHFYGSEERYRICDIGGQLYRIEYSEDFSKERTELLRTVAVLLCAAVLVTAGVLIYLFFAFVKPFNSITGYPKELAKGNLAIPLSEEKNRYFGRFLWGLDMLREKLEDEKKKNLELQREKNVFLLSLSHDMRTPVSAIRLYAAAIKKGLYKDDEKLKNVADKLDENACSIEGYVAGIVSASGKDFLNLETENGEFYISEALNTVTEYYGEKLKDLGTSFEVGKYADILVLGDKDRYVEVLQNIIENAIKYGDGGIIRINSRDEEDARLVTVENSGCTLPDNEAEHIFDSFFRGSNAANKPGSGLGLYIARTLMNRMGGEIFAERKDGEMHVTTVLKKTGGN
jgi:signal transduction histidine kinase